MAGDYGSKTAATKSKFVSPFGGDSSPSESAAVDSAPGFPLLNIGKPRQTKKEKQEEAAREAAMQAEQNYRDYLSSSYDSRNWRPPSSRAAQALVPSSSATGSSVARKTLLGQ